MVNHRRVIELVLVAVLPVGVFGAVASSGVASAAKPPPDTGGIACDFSATATLSVPYTYGGVKGTKKSTTTVGDQTLSNCVASGNALTGGTPGIATIKNKFTKAQADSPPYPQNCNTVVNNMGSTTIPSFKEKITWSDGTKSVVAFSGGMAQRAGLVVPGTVTKGSFAGDSVTLNGDIATSTIVLIETCASGGAPVGTLQFAGGSTLTVS